MILKEANKQIVQVEKEYDLPVQEISTPENKEDETEGSHSELVSEEPEVQEKVEIPEEVERVEVPEATEVSAIQEVAEESQEETPLPIEEPTREPESSSQPVAVSKKEKSVSSVSRKDRDQRVQKKKKQNTIAKRIVLTVLESFRLNGCNWNFCSDLCSIELKCHGCQGYRVCNR